MTFLSGFSVPSARYNSGSVVPISATFSDSVTVSNGAVPFLSLSNGAIATYAGQTDDATLTFNYFVSDTDNATPSLSVTGFALNGASVLAADGSVAATTVTSGVNSQIVSTANAGAAVTIETSLQDIADDLVSPRVASVDVVSGNYLPGDKVTLTVVFDEAVGVTPGAKLPTLTLMSNGEVLDDVI
ncbi:MULTISPECIES: hypothetical protein, partial [unclassified Marinobacterium]